MPTPFADPEIWQHAEFTFELAGEETGQIGSRGQPIVDQRSVTVRFKMRPRKHQPSIGRLESRQDLGEVYEARVVAVDEDESIVKLPAGINGQTGKGNLKGESCRATVTSIAQSSVAPIVASILGEAALIEIDYSIYGGIASA